MKSPAEQKPVLEVENLTTVFQTREGIAVAVNEVSFSLSKGETLGIVGESGCGKTVTALSILRLIRKPGYIASGKILLHGEDILKKSEAEMRSIRGNRISMVFQEPMTSLNPVFTVGSQIMEVYIQHSELSKEKAREKTINIMEHVGVPNPSGLLDVYPHQLSGGLRQRVHIAMSLACNPDVLIADEPTTAIDVTVQAQILRLLNRLKDESGMAVLLISHDLGVVAETCNKIAVMYASNIVETGHIEDIFYVPKHPYTVGLLESIPAVHEPKQKLKILPGQVPRPTHYPPGCNFSSRCQYVTEICLTREPRLSPLDGIHEVSCWNWENVEYYPYRNQTGKTIERKEK